MPAYRQDESQNASDSKEVFVAWLFDFNVVADPTQLFEALRDCRERLPLSCTEPLDLPPSSTYADAVELMDSIWKLGPGERS